MANKNIIRATSIGFISLVFSATAAAELKPFYEESNDEWNCGYKNNTGEIIVPIKEYEDCGEFSDGLAYVGKIERPLVENENGGYKHLQGFIDQTGRLVIPIEHEAVEGVLSTYYKNFSEGLVAVYRNGKYGYMNKQRELMVPYQYQDANEFKYGLAIVIKNDKYGAIDQLGNNIIPLKFNYLSSYSDGLAQYTENNHWNDGYSYGYVNKKGEISIKAKWDDACRFSEGLAAVRVGDYETGKWGIINKTGNYVVKPEYDTAAIQTYTDAYFLDDCYYKQSVMNMYKYTDASNPYESSITRYTLNREGKVISKKFYSNWDTIVEEFIENNGL